MRTKKMNIETIGLNTYLYTFPLECKAYFIIKMEELRKSGNVTEVFLDNELGFEVKLATKLQ